MKWFVVALLLFVILLVAYWAWPFVGLRALADGLQARNAAVLSEQVDFIRLRRSLSAQIIEAYLRVTGRASGLGGLTPLVSAVGASIVDPWVSQIVNPDNLVELLKGGTIQTELGPTSFKFGELPKLSLRTAWNAWLSSQYGLGRFSIGLPADAAADEQFRLQMQLSDWRWKLTGIDLPQKLRDQIARDLAKKYP
jgi:hypothetical protein